MEAALPPDSDTTDLHRAVLDKEEPLVRLLLSRGSADPNLSDAAGRTPLMAAAAVGSLPILRLLLNANADVAGLSGASALHVACDHGHAGCAEALVRAGVDASIESFESESAWDIAKRKGHQAVLQALETALAAAPLDGALSDAPLAGSAPLESLDEDFLSAVLSTPPPAAAKPTAKRARLRAPAPPAGSDPSELTAELHQTGGGGSGLTVRICQPSTGWSAEVTLPTAVVDTDSVELERSRRSGRLYVRYRAPSSGGDEDTAAEVAREAGERRLRSLRSSAHLQPEPEPEPQPEGETEEGEAEAAAVAQFFAAGGAALRGDDRTSETPQLRHWRRRFLRALSASTRAAIMAALQPSTATEQPEPQPLAARKKDLPDPDDEEG